MSRIRNSALPALLICGVLMTPLAAMAAAVVGTAPKAEEKKPAFDIANFSYTSQDRRDPFEQVHLLKTGRKDVSPRRAEERV